MSQEMDMNKMKSVHKSYKTFLIFLYCFLLSCNANYKKIKEGAFIVSIPKNWQINKTSDRALRVFNDSININIRWGNDTNYDASHILSELEYIKYTDPNIITNFAFYKPNVIYTDLNHIKDLKKTNVLNSVKQNPSPILENILKVTDSQLNKNNIDYLLQFKLDSSTKWVSIKLPEYFKQLDFIVDSSKGNYYKLYFPTGDNSRKAGLLIKNSKCKIFVSAKTSLFNVHSQFYNDVLKILKSIELVENCK